MTRGQAIVNQNVVRGGKAMVAGLVLATVLSLVSCSTQTDREGSGNADVPQAGGDLVLAQNDFPQALDPVQSGYYNGAARQVTDNLVDQDKNTGEIIPWLANSWEVSADGESFTFVLRDDVTFSNGEKLTAQLVKDNFDQVYSLAQQGKASQAKTYLLGYIGTDVLDDRSVRLTFDQPRASLLQALTEKPLAIVAKESLNTPLEQRFTRGVIGSGPFVISDVEVGQKVVLKKRTGYHWPSSNAEHQGEAYLDTLTFTLIADDGVKNGSLATGQIDVADTLSVEGIEQTKDFGGQVIYRTTAGSVDTIYFNQSRPVPGDAAVRKAVQIGIDRREVIDTIFDPDYSAAASSPLSSTVPGYVDLSDRLGYQPERAAQILQDAGWVAGADGIRAKDGVRLSLEILRGPQREPALFELLQQELVKIGVELRIRSVTSAEQTAAQQAGDWDLSYGSLTRADPDVLLQTYSNLDTWASRWGANPPTQLFDLLARQSRSLDLKDRAALVEQIQEFIIDESVSVPVTEYPQAVGTRANVHGLWLSIPRFPIYYDPWLSR